MFLLKAIKAVQPDTLTKLYITLLEISREF
jgi:hypothetical protein